ncbi:acetyltransferase [Crocosphaera watsonii]|nr:acetyltransferase [Crocosphaera watsonii]
MLQLTYSSKFIMIDYPDPNRLYPFKNYQRLCFLKNIITNPNIIVGDFTYYDDLENTNNFENNVLYSYLV